MEESLNLHYFDLGLKDIHNKLKHMVFAKQNRSCPDVQESREKTKAAEYELHLQQRRHLELLIVLRKRLREEDS